MLFSTIGQIYVFIWMVAAGILIGAWYALLNALRRLLCAGRWLTLLIDLAFGVGAAALFILALVTGNYGQVRFYVVMGAILGFALFSMGIYLPIKWMAGKCTGVICRLFIKIGQLRWIKVIFK